MKSNSKNGLRPTRKRDAWYENVHPTLGWKMKSNSKNGLRQTHKRDAWGKIYSPLYLYTADSGFVLHFNGELSFFASLVNESWPILILTAVIFLLVGGPILFLKLYEISPIYFFSSTSTTFRCVLWAEFQIESWPLNIMCVWSLRWFWVVSSYKLASCQFTSPNNPRFCSLSLSLPQDCVIDL